MSEPRTEASIDWPKRWTADDIAWVKRQIIAEHEREAAAPQPCQYCERGLICGVHPAPNAAASQPLDAPTREELIEALLWMTGSDHFSPGGMAHEGFQRVVAPVLARLSRKEPSE